MNSHLLNGRTFFFSFFFEEQHVNRAKFLPEEDDKIKERASNLSGQVRVTVEVQSASFM